MKKSKLALFFFIIELWFFLVMPAIFIWLQYGGLAKGYKLSVSAIFLFLIVFLLFKKLMLDDWLDKIKTKIAAIEVQLLAAKDTDVIHSLKSRWRTYSIVQLFFNAIIPVIALIVFIMTIKVVEQGLIKLYACLVFCAISVGFGLLIKVLAIYAAKAEHESKGGK